MLKIGPLELILILVLAITIIVVFVIIAKRLINCRISSTKKIVWIVIMLLFDVVGAVAFFIYHDYILDPHLRAGFVKQ